MDISRLDWSLLQSFVAVAKAGSLSAAARRIGTSQPTLGRHIRALETVLEQPLFTRRAEGQILTALGREILEQARRMEDAAAQIALTAAGTSARLEGRVRITASRVVSFWHLPPILARVRQEEPGIQIDLVASDLPENLMHREADIALRMFRPERGDLRAQKIAELPLALYAARDYLDRRGRPETREALLKLDFIGLDQSDLMLRVMAQNGFEVTPDFFAMRCDDHLVNWALVRAGGGVGGIQQVIGDGCPDVERIADFVRIPALPVWIVVPDALRNVPRIARVREILARELSKLGQGNSAEARPSQS